VNERMMHPAPERLEALVEGSLDPADQAVVESHVGACPRCEGEVEELRSLFAAFAALPQHEPAPGFAERVMAGVRVHTPWPARIAAFVERLFPKTTRGWALASAFLALPLLALGGAVAWVLQQPWATAQGLWLVAETRGTAAAQAAWLWAAERALASPLAVTVGELARAADVRGVGLVALAFGLVMSVSIWILWVNVVRTPSRKITYAS
jgi:anti-sigma factor RsiW